LIYRTRNDTALIAFVRGFQPPALIRAAVKAANRANAGAAGVDLEGVTTAAATETQGSIIGTQNYIPPLK